MRIAYLIPEFPGQTHIFFWREIDALRQRGIEVRLISSRHPPRKVVSHSWAAVGEAETTYLGEMSARDALDAAIGFLRCGPLGWLKSIKAALFSCPVRKIPRNLALLLCAATQLAMKAILREGDAFIVVEANEGALSLLASRLVGSGHVIAFELNPKPRSMLEAAINRNRISIITVHPIGLGAFDATLPLSFPKVNSGEGSFGRSVYSSGDVEIIQCDVRRGDGILAGEEPKLIKIDVEGFEMNVPTLPTSGRLFRQYDDLSPAPQCLLLSGEVLPAKYGTA